MYDDDSDEEIDFFVGELKKAGLKVPQKRKCISTKGKNAGKENTKPDKCKSMNLTRINIENLPFVEKLGDQYIELNSETCLETIPTTSQNSNDQFIASSSKRTENPTPLMNVPMDLCTTTVPANALYNQIIIQPQDAPLVQLVCAPLSQVAEVIEILADNNPNSSPNESPETLTELLCTPIAPTTSTDVLKDGLPYQNLDNWSEAPAPIVCSPLHSSSLIEGSAQDPSNLQPYDSSEAHVSPRYSQPLTPSLMMEAPVEDHPNVIFQSNSQPSLGRDEIQSSDPSFSNINVPATNNRLEIISDVPYHGDLTSNKKRNCKATKDPKLWQRNNAKDKREKGESYLGYRRDKKEGSTKFKVKHDVVKPARSLKPPCTSAFCIRSKLRACDSINSESRLQLFTTFWKNMSWEQRRAYICSHVLKIEKKITKNPHSNRGESRAYYLTIEHERHQVCKKMFLATLGIKDWFVRYWLEKTDCAMPPDTQTSKNRKKGPEKTDSKEYLIQFLTKLPKMPSHYCRQSTSKLYLEPVFDSMVELYRVYKNACQVDSQPNLGRKLFGSIFDQLNLALFHPKKDQCDLCCSYKIGNLSEEDYNQHILKKNRARAEKATDKLFAETGELHVFTQDVESVKMVPFLQASAIYYKTKLCVHNFTVYNLATQEVMCYWFDESNGRLEASVFASCVVDYISNTLNKKCLPVILYSDGCCAQNRNAILSNALLRLAIEKKVVITQKYLEKGHTQMECDSVHSAIECKLKGKEIYLPEQYVDLSNKSRTQPMPYEGKLLDFNFFTDYTKDLIYKSIRPGKKVGDPVVTDIRVLEYSPDGIIKYKTCFDEELKPLPLRPTPLHRITPTSELLKLYTERLPIANRKYQDLQDLKAVIPERCHAFYDQLSQI